MTEAEARDDHPEWGRLMAAAQDGDAGAYQQLLRDIAPLMGWVGSEDTRTQLRLRFDTRDEAVAFAERNELTYDVFEPQPFVVRPKSYAENFRV